MSLIGDALRKARQEAAERDNERMGLLFSAKIADRPARSNLGLGIALGALIAVVATVAGGLAVWWVLGGPPTRETAPAASGAGAGTEAGAETGTGTGAGAGTESGTEAETGTGTGAEAAATTTDTASAPATDTATETVTVSDAGADAGAGTDSTPATATPEPETGFLGEEDGAEIYLMEAEVGGGVISLDFLVFREPDPYVEINGVELHLGGTIEGFRVDAIEKDRVRLTDGRRTIVLRAP